MNTAYFGDYAHKVDWPDEEATNYILFSTQVHSNQVMMLSHENMNSMLKPDHDTVWDKFYLYKDLEIQPLSMLHDLFEHHFPLFLSPYSSVQNASQFKKLLTILNLGELQPVFEAAIKAKKSKKKLNDLASQETLAEIFSPHLDYSTDRGRHLSLKNTHYQDLLQAYYLSSADNSEKAKTLLSLAALFTKFSSSDIFGTEGDSPEMLRHYAYALMEKAYALDPSIFIAEIKTSFDEVEIIVKEDRYKNCTERLLGLKKAFSCTYILSIIMVDHGKKKFPKTLMRMMPPAWF